ncbi:MAG: cupin domain-containing protein, partial [bacterium]
YDGEEWEVTAGDFLAFQTGPDHSHKLINTSDQPLRYICVSTMEDPDAMVYPDSGKVGILSGSAPGGTEQRNFEGFFDLDAERDYWDGEIPDDS